MNDLDILGLLKAFEHTMEFGAMPKGYDRTRLRAAIERLERAEINRTLRQRIREMERALRDVRQLYHGNEIAPHPSADADLIDGIFMEVDRLLGQSYHD